MAAKPGREPAATPDHPQETPARKMTVVGIGASAGGLGALKQFFAVMPADTGLAFVVVVHLAPQRESHLAELLQPKAKMPVQQVVDSAELEPNHVYVIPPGRNLSAVDTHLRVTAMEPDRLARAPVDHFLRTLAETRDGSSIAVILSGTGTDGAEGVRHIREAGGLVLVQDPGEAEYDGMPRSAINSGVVDLVSPVAEMPQHIANFVRTKPQVPTADDGRPRGEGSDLMQQILTAVRVRTGQDFSRYKRSTVGRRVMRRMQVVGVQTLDQYLELTREKNGREAAALLDDLLINVTSFFRDAAVFRMLEKDVIPRLFEGKGATDKVRVWSVGCATGEEAYSTGMLLLEEASRRPKGPQVQVFASDLHERSLRYARDGLYPAAIAHDVPRERLDRFFREQDGGYRVTKPLRDIVVFAAHNLLQDPPFSWLDLIVCRNVLIYFQGDAQREVIDLFHYALNPGGFLLLGTAETLERSDLFRLDSKESHLYRRRDGRRRELRLPAAPPPPPPAPGPGPGPGPSKPAADTRGDEAQAFDTLHLRMLERYSAPSILMDQDYTVVHLSEGAGAYLLHPSGSPTMSVFKLLREDLRVELRATLLTAREKKTEVRSRPVPIGINGNQQHVVLRVSPAGEGELEGLILVVFDEVEPAPPVPTSAGGAQADASVRALETELDVTRNRLQSMMEEFETSQEEMRASNEELQSANEELRSTMEELETSREELQSINEELQTLNQENKHKVEELSQLTNDLQNLLQATDVATVFLDRNLRILRYTPRVSGIFNVRHSDRGRPLADLTHRLRYPGLIDDAREVLQALVPIEREIESETKDGWYVVRVSPYRTMDDRIEGVVITIIDITALKLSETALRASEARFRAAVNVVPDLLWQAGPDGSTSWFNDRWYGYTGQTPAEAEGFGWLNTLHPNDREESRAAWAAALAEKNDSFRREHRVRRADGQYRWFLVRAAPLRDEREKVIAWFGAATDVHEHRLMLEEFEQRVTERTNELGNANAALERAAAERNSLRRQLTAAEEDERRRLARELHDQLGQNLTAFALGLTEARRLLGAGSKEQAESRLSHLEELAQLMTRDARYLALELRPAELDDLGLGSAVETYVNVWSKRYNIGTEVAVSGIAKGDVDDEAATAIYRILQEALTNVAKHAHATHASVIVERVEGELRAVVEDNGRGFDVDSVMTRRAPNNRFGLAGIQERAAMAGGNAHIESSPSRGTTLYVRLPKTEARSKSKGPVPAPRTR
jgi:two-component system, chemotaxis family, CheB/CheR fusion protein